MIGGSTLTLGALAAPAFAQESATSSEEDAIIVTGVRGSLTRAMDIKRSSSGVVDAISAEDIGKMPDTNLAESLQRITGVSINRVNGEGSLITARGFGSEFNLVTLNGRQMPTANIGTIGGGDGADFATGTTRQFDFSNLASEGVSRLEVYKTGRASIPTGGIGATVNIVTARPFDLGEGYHATIGVKALNDSTVLNGDDITPEVSGLFSWTDDARTLGVSAGSGATAPPQARPAIPGTSPPATRSSARSERCFGRRRPSTIRPAPTSW
jgi:TonB-dependent receptor